jgi:hypothetical protein
MSLETLAMFVLPEIPAGSYVIRGYEEGQVAQRNGLEYIPVIAVFETTEDLAEAWKRADQLIGGNVSDYKYQPAERVAYFLAGTLGETEDGQIGFQPNDQGGENPKSAPVDIDESDVRNTELDEFLERDVKDIGLPQIGTMVLTMADYKTVGRVLKTSRKKIVDTFTQSRQIDHTLAEAYARSIGEYFQNNRHIGYDPWPER